MARPLASIDAQIAALESQLATASGAGAFAGVADGNTSANYRSIEELMKVLNGLYMLRDRLSGARPMFARGRVVGLPNGSSTSSSTFQ